MVAHYYLQVPGPHLSGLANMASSSEEGKDIFHTFV